MTHLPNGKPSGIKMDATPLLISGQVNLDMQNRVAAVPVRRRLDLSAQMVALPFYLIKGLAAQVIDAERRTEQAVLAGELRPPTADPNAEKPA